MVEVGKLWGISFGSNDIELRGHIIKVKKMTKNYMRGMCLESHPWCLSKIFRLEVSFVVWMIIFILYIRVWEN